MNGFLLLIPFLLIRFGVLSHLDRAAVKRAAFFAPMAGKEIAAYWIYQLSNAAIAAPSGEGLNQNGLYRFSRNPMYLSYFILFMGCALLTHSVLLGGIDIIFQLSSHWIILSEERWCIGRFGDAYRQYMKRVRRYI